MHLICHLTRPALFAPLATLIRNCSRATIKAFLLVLALPALLWAADITLAWDANEPAPEGYRVYQRIAPQPYHFNQPPAWEGSGTTCTIRNLQPGMQYHFVVRAYTGTLESNNSNEVGFRTPTGTEPAPTGNTGIENSSPKPDLTGNGNVDQTPTSPTPTQGTLTEPPIAQAGANQTVTSASKVQLNASESVHPQKLPLTYQWTQTAGPSVGLADGNTPWASFTAPSVATGKTVNMLFELTVTDTRKLSSSDTCVVLVTGPAPPAIDDPALPGTGGDPAVGGGSQNTDSGKSDAPHPPAQPIVYYPVDGADGLPLTPRLTASDFCGGDKNDTHQRSEWRIWKTRGQQVVLDVTRGYHSLNRLWVPFFTLTTNTTYTCKVRYWDHRDQASEWSVPVTFTARGSWFSRSDAMVAYTQLAPLATDLNGNGIPDLQEADKIQTLQTADGRRMMALSIHDSAHVRAIDHVAAVDPETMEPLPPTDSPLPYGLLAYRLEVDQPGRQTHVTLHLSDPIDPLAPWMVYGADGQWKVGTDEAIQVSADGLTVVRTIEDGGEHDVDGVANGVIVDLLGPLATSETPDSADRHVEGATSNNSSSDSSDFGWAGCFINTLKK
ncbi:MAG: fibronectin type III domain-containing protein [Desulfatitalea sp.]|nr:fibronectin type III domain-containing protein [Desulfatitalea sp.]